MEVRFTREALKALRRMPKLDALRVRAAIDALAADPRDAALDVRPLVGRDGALRLRVGDWRVLFAQDGAVLAILRVAHRREAYR